MPPLFHGCHYLLALLSNTEQVKAKGQLQKETQTKSPLFNGNCGPQSNGDSKQFVGLANSILADYSKI